jgi:hypothetical protein
MDGRDEVTSVSQCLVWSQFGRKQAKTRPEGPATSAPLGNPTSLQGAVQPTWEPQT